MNDRTHFLLSCAILVLVISLALRPQLTELPPQISVQESNIPQEPSLNSIQQFLEIEEGLTMVSMEPALPDQPEIKKNRLHLNRDRREFIPMNVVPLQAKTNRKPATQTSAVSAQKPQITTPQARQISSRENRQLEQFDSNASSLIDQSQDSFSRGLLSLSDYQLALNIAYQSKIDVGEIRGAKGAKIGQLTAKQALLEQAVDQLKMLNQPAAHRWYGDLLHSRLMLAQNQYEIAAASDNQYQKGLALREINRLSEQYYSVRRQELQVGEADLNEYRRAARSIFVANLETNSFQRTQQNDLSNLADFTRQLEGIQKAVETLAERGAGLGRKDLVELSQAQLSFAQGNYYRQQKDDRRSRAMFEQSQQHAKAAWEVRMNTYYPNGTATLHELTSAWIMWRSADTELNKSDTSTSVKPDRDLTAGLDRMLNLTSQIEDRRGRMASDISLVNCLKDSELLTELKKKSE
ncbi:hypothetical protein Pan153_14670 [Gimesia panareensis]|uniref:Uncharacterized protein n=2 Tax=Gimesia panareensis TaxID=2527978 RepID=A0A518FKG7_9PLAN|nr:hypothetical protein Pan110_22250 [Gimesia panareensis]QDV16834.1 hypothetical protein Pan153_14670 [Gimesia panareensis]